MQIFHAIHLFDKIWYVGIDKLLHILGLALIIVIQNNLFGVLARFLLGLGLVEPNGRRALDLAKEWRTATGLLSVPICNLYRPLDGARQLLLW